MPLRRHSRISSRQSKRFVEKRRERVLVGGGLVLVCLASWIFALSRFSSLEALSIESVRVYGADPDIAPSVEAAASAAIQGSYLGLFSRSNALIYPASAVAAGVASVSPRIVSADVKRDGWRALIVSVSEKAPAALVCADLPNFDQNGVLSDDDDCYAADATGLIFEKMPADAADAAFGSRYYAPDLPDDPSAIGLYATSTAEFAALRAFVQGVKSAGLEPEAVLMKSGGEYELYAADPAGQTAAATSTAVIVVYFNDQAGLSAELSDLSAFWSHVVATAAAAGQPPQSFQYIDLRYGSNVFYR